MVNERDRGLRGEISESKMRRCKGSLAERSLAHLAQAVSSFIRECFPVYVRFARAMLGLKNLCLSYAFYNQPVFEGIAPIGVSN